MRFSSHSDMDRTIRIIAWVDRVNARAKDYVIPRQLVDILRGQSPNGTLSPFHINIEQAAPILHRLDSIPLLQAVSTDLAIYRTFERERVSSCMTCK